MGVESTSGSEFVDSGGRARQGRDSVHPELVRDSQGSRPSGRYSGGRVTLDQCIIYGWWKFGTKVGRGAQAFINRCLYVALEDSDESQAIVEDTASGGVSNVRDSYLLAADGSVVPLGAVTDPALRERVLGLVSEITEWGAQPHGPTTSRS